MTTNRLTTILMAMAVSLLAPAVAQGQVSFEYFAGTAANLHTPLTIKQDGQPEVSFTAHYSVRPFDDRAYYVARIGFWSKETAKGWLIELIHHKLYLENPTPEVEHFEVTHGFNMVTVNRGWHRDKFLFLLGGGVVVPHTNSVVRGLERPITAPYTLAGVAAQGAAGRRVDFTSWLFASVEGKVTAAWARVPIANGNATVPNVAFHGLVGIGAEF